MAPPAAPLRCQLDLEVFEQTVHKLFDAFGVPHDVKSIDGEAVDLDLDVRHVLNRLLAEQETLFRQWQFEEARHFEERLQKLDRSWQRRWKVMERGSARNVQIKPEKASEAAAEESAASRDKELSRGSTGIKPCPDGETAQTKDGSVQSTTSLKEPSEEHLASEDSRETLAPGNTCMATPGNDFRANPSIQDDDGKRGADPANSWTPATSPSRSPLTGARGPVASPATPKPVAESPVRPRSGMSERFASLLGKFGGSRS